MRRFNMEIAGIPVGKVDLISIREYKADVRMQIQKGIGLPDDTIASVKTRGAGSGRPRRQWTWRG